MGRNKDAFPLTKRERKLKKEGLLTDVIVGMHGAAMTHLLFARQRAVAVELFSGTLISLRKGGGLWFFARYTKGYYGKIFLDRGPREQRSTLDAAQAARTVRCASEASAGPRAKRPSCDK